MKGALTTWLCCLSAAPTERGNVTGAVTDPGASAIVSNMTTNQTVTVSSTSAGGCNVPNLSPGENRVEVSAAGFKKAARRGSLSRPPARSFWTRGRKSGVGDARSPTRWCLRQSSAPEKRYAKGR